MAIGLYVHVPFCIRKCNYCDFVSYPYNKELAQVYLDSLQKEIELYAKTLDRQHKRIATIFVGGGTPTCLMSGYLEAILETIYYNFEVVLDAEITTEANPGTVNLSYLKGLTKAGYNRLSLGVQSTHKKLLATLGRIHDVEEASRAVEMARGAGFKNVNLDLIFGLPGQSLDNWYQTLLQVLEWQTEHLSCYGLQLEEGTPLAQAIERQELQCCLEDDQLAMYLLTIEVLTKAGYQHYEISNFTKPGYQCRHNLIYWDNENYLGLGPAAHSYIGNKRWSNAEGLRNYAKLLQGGLPPLQESHDLTLKEQMEETVFLGLRLIQGLDLNRFNKRFGVSLDQIFAKQVQDLTKKGLLETEGNYLRLTSRGLPVANQVFSEFV